MSATKHVLFVCTGNTCRSPMAEGLMRKHLAGREDFTTSSAGVAACRGGSMSPETRRILEQRDAGFDGFQSQPVTPELLDQASHVFAMTEGHLAMIEHAFPEHADKLFLVREFSGISDKSEGIDVPDPIGMGLPAYEEVAKVLAAAIPQIAAYVDSRAG